MLVETGIQLPRLGIDHLSLQTLLKMHTYHSKNGENCNSLRRSHGLGRIAIEIAVVCIYLNLKYSGTKGNNTSIDLMRVVV